MTAVQDRGSGDEEEVLGTGSGPVLEEELMGLANAGLLREETKMTGHFIDAEERGICSVNTTMLHSGHVRGQERLMAPLPWEILS